MKDGGDSSGRHRAKGSVSETTAHKPAAAPMRDEPMPQSGPAVRAGVARDGDALSSIVPMTTYVADEVAAMALAARHADRERPGSEAGATATCDACDGPIEGEPAGRGLYFWARDGELRWEEPGLCEDCAAAIVATASRRFEIEEEEG
ncbi:MAG: hypothetical protein HOW73_26165 [Polyangiaceae bacterium]|nr:hypothetical protein [Polyangiaceae bacterium]